MGLARTLTEAAYRAQQISLMSGALAIHQAVRLVSRNRIEFDARAAQVLKERYLELLRRDVDNAEAGLYPHSLLFRFPFASYLRAFPALVRDIPRTVRRLQTQQFLDLPPEAASERYPSYFRRTFHWQTDGYFSRRSAAIYDAGVELLFMGTADVMRRQVIPPITRFVREQGASEGRLLDIACGTGRTLLQIATAHPGLRLYGLDLSPFYIQQARELLADLPEVSLVAENGENLPFVDGYFDVVTSVYLFHELPRAARRRVMAEAYRVLRPGGLIVLEDSGQISDSEDIAFFYHRFHRDFHEPYYKGYLQDDLEAGLAEVGFEVTAVETHLVSKVVIARKPPH
ncbi:MAG TPA: class I SAM-dependent methyltransferase [Kofleriaceae bacterium]|nr:class I SAM-dependent methyltransferase [Kofleriaceae bacterium]